MKRALIQLQTSATAPDLLDSMGKAFIHAWESGQSADPVTVLTFTSPAQLFSVISPKRWDLIERLQQIGGSSIRGLARALGRDVKRVHEDVTLLIEWGIIERDEDGKVVVPYGVIQADFDLRAAA